MCNLFLNMCIVGLVQTGPSTYFLQTITDLGVIKTFVVYENDSCTSTEYVCGRRSGSLELSRPKHAKI